MPPACRTISPSTRSAATRARSRAASPSARCLAAAGYVPSISPWSPSRFPAPARMTIAGGFLFGPVARHRARRVRRDRRRHVDLPDRAHLARRVPRRARRPAHAEALRQAFRRRGSATCSSCASCRSFRFGSSISPRRCSACGFSLMLPRQRSASCRRRSCSPISDRASEPRSTAKVRMCRWRLLVALGAARLDGACADSGAPLAARKGEESGACGRRHE